MKTAIIILNYNSKEDTIRFVNEIKDFKVLDKIIVVDNKFFEDICDNKAFINNNSCRVGYMCPNIVYI